MLVRPCVQNAPGKIGEVSPSGYSLYLRESGPKFVQGPGGVVMLQPLRWRCVDCVIHHERDVRKA